MITSRGITFLAGAGLAWLAGRTLGVAELYVVSVAAAAVVGLGVAYVRLTTSAIAVRRLVDHQRVVAGTHVDVVVELRNDGRVLSPTLLVAEELPRGLDAVGHPAGQARFVVGGVAAGRIARAAYRLHAAVRGRYRVGPLVLRVRDPFGVAERTRRYTATHDLLVYPRIDALPSTPVRGIHMGAGSSDTRRVFATGEDFYTMREYVKGDDLRHVHWPSTAHRDTLMVRQMEQPWQAHATVYLDARATVHTAGPEGTLEKAVSVAASMVYHLSDAAYMLRLVTDTTAGRSTPGSWEVAMDRLAVIGASENRRLGPSLAATRGGEGLFVGVLGVPDGSGDPASHPDLAALFGVRGFGQRIAFVVTDTGRRATHRAERTAVLLRGTGWNTVTITPGGRLAGAWSELSRGGSRRGVAAG